MRYIRSLRDVPNVRTSQLLRQIECFHFILACKHLEMSNQYEDRRVVASRQKLAAMASAIGAHCLFPRNDYEGSLLWLDRLPDNDEGQREQIVICLQLAARLSDSYENLCQLLTQNCPDRHNEGANNGD